MTTKQVEPEVDAWREQEGRQRRSTNGKKIVAFAVAAAIAVAAVAVILATREEPPIPAGGPPAVEEVARAFVDAYGAFDSTQASTYLADNADLSGLILSTAGVDGAQEGFRRTIDWSKAVGWKQTVTRCTILGNTSGGIAVKCPFEFTSLGADEIGLGPYGGSSFNITVSGGKIVSASAYLEIRAFSPEVWEPFARWVSTTYPNAAAVMYEDSTYSSMQLTLRSIHLWELRTREYVRAVELGTAGQ